MFERFPDRLRLDRLPTPLLQLDHLRISAQRYGRGPDVAAHFKKALDALPAPVKHCVTVVVKTDETADFDELFTIEMLQQRLRDRNRKFNLIGDPIRRAVRVNGHAL